VWARIPVVVESEPSGHLLYLGVDSEPKGAIAEFVRKMNEVQDKYEFKLNVVPRLRLNLHFQEGKADVYPLKAPLWVDPALKLQPSRPILISGTVYIARADNAFGGHKVFDDLRRRRLAVVRGYHYQLFDNNPGEAFILRHFSAALLSSNDAVVRFVLAGRADVGIVPEAVMAQFFQEDGMRHDLIVGERFDSQIPVSNLVRQGAPITVEAMSDIVELLEKSGEVGRLKAVYNLKR
jgi:ABC-type amino acid transport substrate-binding protein